MFQGYNKSDADKSIKDFRKGCGLYDDNLPWDEQEQLVTQLLCTEQFWKQKVFATVNAKVVIRDDTQGAGHSMPRSVDQCQWLGPSAFVWRQIEERQQVKAKDYEECEKFQEYFKDISESIRLSIGARRNGWVNGG